MVGAELTPKDDGVFRDLVFLSTLRGDKGSGLAALYNDGTTNTFKTPVAAAYLSNSVQMSDHLKKPHKIVLGHARAPTRGGDDASCLHPHIKDHIIGIHNGTMYRVAGQKVETDTSDSALLFEAIASLGVKEALKDSYGNYTLIWLDTKERTINFIRNTGRPLVLADVGKKGDVRKFFFSSQENMLSLAMARNHYKEEVSASELPVDKHFMLPWDGIRENGLFNAEITTVTGGGTYDPGFTGARGTNHYGGGGNAGGYWRGGKWVPFDDYGAYGSRQGAYDKWNDEDPYYYDRTKGIWVLKGDAKGKSPGEAPPFTDYKNRLRKATKGKDVGTHHIPRLPAPKQETQPAKHYSINWALSASNAAHTIDQVKLDLSCGCEWCQVASDYNEYLSRKVVWFEPHKYICVECIDTNADVQNVLNMYPIFNFSN